MASNPASARLERMAAELRRLGDRGVTNAARAGLRAAAKPLVADVKSAARARLPRAGGLNERVASSRVSVSVPFGERTVAVTLRTTAGATRMTNEGRVRHPTFGRRGAGSWVTQEIPQAAGWWTDTLTRDAPKVAAALSAAMDAATARLRSL